MIGVILPTRGLVYTKVEQAIEELREGHEIKVYRSYDLQIPEGHNRLTKQALDDGCEWLFYIEEDTVPPSGALEKLLQAHSNIACIDYGVSGWGCVTRDTEGKVLWCGMGCTLVNRKVFQRLSYPYFRVDMSLVLEIEENELPVIKEWKKLPEEYIKNKQYGSLDIWFCDQARKLGFEIIQVEGECEHLELISLGKKEANNGLHIIKAKPNITKKQIIKHERG